MSFCFQETRCFTISNFCKTLDPGPHDSIKFIEMAIISPATFLSPTQDGLQKLGLMLARSDWLLGEVDVWFLRFSDPVIFLERFHPWGSADGSSNLHLFSWTEQPVVYIDLKTTHQHHWESNQLHLWRLSHHIGFHMFPSIFPWHLGYKSNLQHFTNQQKPEPKTPIPLLSKTRFWVV